MAITVKHTKVSTVPDSADTSLVRPSDWNADHALTGLGTAAEKDVGVANGVASLDGTGKVPISELPSAVIGALNYQGTWNASTNTPTLASGVGTKGYYYVVNVAGTTNLDGITDWQIGDWAVYNGTAWQKVDNTDAGGDVVGPASSTDNAITRFDGTTGRVIQNSTVTLDDNGNIINANSLGLDTTPATVPTTVGTMYWDTGNKAPSITLENGVELQLGQENVVLVYNNSASTITNGSVVAVNGAQGQRPAVVLADADSEPLSAGTLGIATENIASGAEGFVTTFGIIRGIDTSAFTAGNPVYLSSTAGQFTATRPSAPAHTVFLGWIIKVNASSGELFVNISNGWELDELHNVLISSPTGGNLLAYDQTNAYWKNINLTDGTGISVTEATGGAITVTNTGVTALSAGTGISVSGSTGSVTVTNSDTGSAQNIFKNIAVSGQSTVVADTNNDTLTLANGTGITLTTNATTDTITVTNSAPDQTVALTGGTGITTSGTYPNFTITNAGVTSFSAGTTGLTPSTGTTGAVTLAGTLAVANGGTGATSAANARTNLGATTVGGNMFTLTNPSAVTFPRFNADNTVSALNAADFRTAIGAGTGSGTVTSVTGTSPVASSGGTTPAISLSSGYGDTQNPYASKTANNFLAAPNGTAGLPTFRAIVAADIPTLNQNTTGTASNVTGTVAVANGGTGATTAATALTNLGAAPLASPAFTGTPTAPTAASSTANTQIATTNYVKSLFSSASTSGTLDWNDVSNTRPGTGPTLLLGSATNGMGGGNYYHPFNIEYAGTSGTGNVTQLAIAYGTPANEIYMRGKYSNAWSSWVRFLNSSNYNSYSPTLTGTGASGTWGINITGNAANVTGTVAIANGGTGQTTATAAFNALNPMTTTGDIIYEASPTTAARLGIGSTGQVLTVAGGIPSWATPTASNITTLGLYENSATISANYTIGSGNNAMSAGPITINTGVTVTVPTGSTWTVV